MVPITNITGRLGNQMFQFAFMYAYSKDIGTDYYFQDPSFFEGYEDEIRTIFSKGIGTQTDAVAIHIRRGANPSMPSEPKYSENPFYVNLSATDYYERAIAMFPNEKFVIFTDDPIYVTDEWKLWDKDRMTLSEGKSDVEDLNLMASCKAHIIANSTFSWWGAWLSPNYPNNTVIAPSQWFSDGVERTKLPSNWKTI